MPAHQESPRKTRRPSAASLLLAAFTTLAATACAPAPDAPASPPPAPPPASGEIPAASQPPNAASPVPAAATARAIQALFAHAKAMAASGDAPGAIADLAAILDFPDANHSHFNAVFLRGALHRSAGDSLAARADLNAIFSFPTTPDAHGPVFFLRPAALAGETLADSDARLTREIHDTDGDLAAFAAARNTTPPAANATGNALPPPGTPTAATTAHLATQAARNAAALLSRGIARAQASRHADAVADFRAIAEHPAATREQKAEAAFFRATALGILGDIAGENAAFAEITSKNAPLTAAFPEDLRPAATLLKIMASGHSGGIDRTIPRFNTLITAPGVTPARRAALVFLRGLATGRGGDIREAMEDFHLVLTDSVTPPELALIVRRHFHDPPKFPAEPF